MGAALLKGRQNTTSIVNEKVTHKKCLRIRNIFRGVKKFFRAGKMSQRREEKFFES